MIFLLLALAQSCPAPSLIDHSGVGWTDKLGSDTIQRAEYVCRHRYLGCLVRLERMDPLRFRAMCRKQSKGG